MHDRASQALAKGIPTGVPKSFRVIADYSNVPRTTLQHRARGRRSREEKSQSQCYLYPCEEKALVQFLVQQDSIGRSVRIKHIPEIAFKLASKRSVNRPKKPPGKNWPQLFYKRHTDALKTSKSGVLDWNRFNIYDKVASWFNVMHTVVQNSSIPEELFFNMDETGVMLSMPNSVKVLVSKELNPQGHRGARIKRTQVTAIECVSASGRCLDPMVIWPASTHRANWVTYPTPGWHYAFSDNGYTDSYLSLQWLKLVFDPQTKAQADSKPRVLICDGFGSHETLEILEFCFENNILLCRIPSHTSHKLQPCDVSVFGPLKTAYREQVDRMERGGVGTIGKEHFTLLYSRARDAALTSRNIRAGWAKAGLFPFNPQKVLDEIPRPQVGTNARAASAQAQVPQPLVSPATPKSAGAVASLHDLITQDTDMVDETSKQRLLRHLQKLTNATQVSFAERALLGEQVQFLNNINNEAKVRRGAKAEVIGTARVMSYEDLDRARKERALKTAAKEAKKAAKGAKEGKKPKTVSSNDMLSAEGETVEQGCAPVARMW